MKQSRSELTGEVAKNYDVYYSVHAENFGWLGWAKNGEEAGTAGYGYRLEAIKIQLVTKGDKAPELIGTIKEAMKARLVGYQTHVQDYGTQAYVYDGAMAGTEGECKRMESIRMKLPSSVNSSIQYRSHVQDIGWEKNWASNGSLSGTTGQCKRLEAIQIRLTGEVAKNYDVYYSVHAENFGWLGWAKNGEEAGTAGYGYRLEAIKIQLVTKGDKAPELIGTIKEAMKARLVGYQTHVQDYGTQAYVYDGAMAGTEGECKRMESIRMKLPSSVNSSIQYRSHVQDIGWEKNWASNGSLSGTTGQCKRLEAIQIKLSGDVAKNYDVYYRVHAQDYGWLAWAKNGESSGTEGYAKRLEAIEVRLVPKGTTPDLPASANEKAFIKKK